MSRFASIPAHSAPDLGKCCWRSTLLTLLLFAALTAHAQPQTILAGPASCGTCHIELEQVVVFGDSTGPGMLREQSRVTIDRRGRFYVSSNYDPVIVVFDARGRFLRRVGRQGQGPGEFPHPPSVLIGPGDTVYALHGTSRRLTVFSPDYELVRTATLSVFFNTSVALPDGRLMLSGLSPRAADPVRNPLHIVDQKGVLIRSFGAPIDAQAQVASRTPGARRFANPFGQNLWTVGVEELVLEQWNFEGKRLAHIVRQAPWWPPRRSPPPPDATPGTHREPPQIRALSQDSAGLLWTLTLVPDRNWRPYTLPAHPDGGGTYTPDSLRHKITDSVLEVIDPGRGVVVATQTFDTLFMGFVAPDLLVSYSEDAAGNPRYIVWRTRLVSPSR